MTICALTMVYRDHWALSRWYAHHARELGAGNLFVVAHGSDPEIARICPGANVWTVPRGDLDHFDRWRGEMLDGFHTGLAKAYDWVIRTDADELICYDPELFGDLSAAIAAHADTPVLWALGFDLVERAGDAPLRDGPVFGQRRHIGFSGHYSKAVAARRPIGFQLHGVRVAPRRLEGFPYRMPRGLYLAHLKYANGGVLAEANAVRMDVAGGAGRGLPGAGWQAADDDALKFLETFEAKDALPWDKAERKAHETLSVKPSRLERHNVVKTRALKLPYRTELPERFSGQG